MCVCVCVHVCMHVCVCVYVLSVCAYISTMSCCAFSVSLVCFQRDHVLSIFSVVETSLTEMDIVFIHHHTQLSINGHTFHSSLYPVLKVSVLCQVFILRYLCMLCWEFILLCLSMHAMLVVCLFLMYIFLSVHLILSVCVCFVECSSYSVCLCMLCWVFILLYVYFAECLFYSVCPCMLCSMFILLYVYFI